MRDDDAGALVANDRTTAVALLLGIHPRGDGYLLAPHCLRIRAPPCLPVGRLSARVLRHAPSSPCVQTVGIKEGKRSFEPRNFLRVGEGIEARRKAGKRPELPKIGHFGSGYSGFGGGGGGSLRQKGGAGLERGLQILPPRYP